MFGEEERVSCATQPQKVQRSRGDLRHQPPCGGRRPCQTARRGVAASAAFAELHAEAARRCKPREGPCQLMGQRSVPDGPIRLVGGRRDTVTLSISKLRLLQLMQRPARRDIDPWPMQRAGSSREHEHPNQVGLRVGTWRAHWHLFPMPALGERLQRLLARCPVAVRGRATALVLPMRQSPAPGVLLAPILTVECDQRLGPQRAPCTGQRLGRCS